MKLLLRLVGLLAGVILLRPSEVSAQGTAFSCDGTFYQIKQPTNSTTSFLYRVNRSTAAYTTQALNVNLINGNVTNDLGVILNGLAYNSQDGYMYALTTSGVNGTNSEGSIYLYKIGQGETDTNNPVPGIVKLSTGPVKVGSTNVGITVSSGTFDKAGNYYFTAQNNSNGTADNNLYKIVVANVTAGAVTATRIAMSPAVTMYDMALNPLDGQLYGVNWLGSLYRVDPTSGAVTTISPAGSQYVNLAQYTSGSVFFDIAGNLFAYANGSPITNPSTPGGFYQINTTSGVYTKISSGDPVSVSDGASCINPGNAIDVTKMLTNVTVVDASTYDVSYTIRVRNTYTTTDANVQVSDLLLGNTTTTTNVTFPTAQSVTIQVPPAVNNLDGSTLVANSAYTGLSATPSGSLVSGAALLSGDQSLSTGQRVEITYTVRVKFANPASVPSKAQNNTAYATSTSSTPNKGYTLSSNDVLLPPSELVANDASTNILPTSTDYPTIRTADSNGTPIANDTPSPTPVTFTPTFAGAVSGTVFEDVNYGGGLGRSLQTSQGVQLSGATVELYSGSGTSATYVISTTTDANGYYSFINLTPGSSYVVRVVNSTVTSSRSNPSNTTGLVGVQTYRTSVDATNGTVADLNRVGGEYPDHTDAAAVTSTSTTLASLQSTSTSTTPGTTAQSIAAVTLSSADASAAATAVDFGYNFDTVVNTYDVAVSGTNAQGSLRQFIVNSNALRGESALAQVYTKADGSTTAINTGSETSIFMVPNGAAVPGQQAGLTSQVTNTMTSSGLNGKAAVIGLTSSLTAVIGAMTIIDGSTQTNSTGDTNPLYTNSSRESTGPEVLLNLNAKSGLALNANNVQLLNMGVYGSPSTSQGVSVGTGSSAVTGVTLNNNTIYSNGVNLLLNSNATATITNNIIRGALRPASDPAFAGPGISLQGNNNGMTINGNQILRNFGFGISFTGANSSNVVSNNLISGNGAGYSTSTFTTSSRVAGISLRGAGSNGNTFMGNTITNNAGSGIVALAGTQGNIFSQNSFSGNGTVSNSSSSTASSSTGLAIDLTGTAASTEDGDGVTLNDAGDTDAATATNGANGLLNFPALQTVTLQGSTLTVTGYARPNTKVELYLAAPDPTGFGEGSSYLTTFTQANAAGTMGNLVTGTTTGYSNTTQGSDDATTLTFTYTYTIPTAQQSQLVTGAQLTSTATLVANSNGNFGTSEFSGNVPITAPAPLPVELVAFTAQVVQNRDVLLSWRTASELNNDHFEVERSLDGSTFAKVGQLAGQGSTASSTSYSFLDAGSAARVPAGQPLYYRLRQVDRDDSSTYSTPRTVRFAAAAAAGIVLFPNPVTAAASLDLSALPAANTYQVLLLDATGCQVYQATFAGGRVQPLNLRGLATGTYQVVVAGAQADGSPLRQVLRLSKQ